MPIKNYTTKVRADKSIFEIQESLVRHGAIGIAYQYEQGTGRIEALHFQLSVGEQTIAFRLPVEYRKFEQVLKNEDVRISVKAWDWDAYVYNVAWRNLCDWVLAQMALYETRMVEIPQLFLPFAVGRNGQTLYQQVMAGQFLLGEGEK